MKDQDGKEVFARNKEYAVYDFHFAHNKDGYIGLDHWDITAMEHVDLSLKPGKTDSNTFVVPLVEGTKSVEITAQFRYLYEQDKTATIHTATKTVEF